MICLMPVFWKAGKCRKPTSSDGAMRSMSGSSSSWPKFHGVVYSRPRLVGLLVGAHQHAAALLAQIELAVEIDRVDHLLAGLGVDLGDLRHVLGDQVHVLHGEHRQFEPDHAADLARPQPAGIDDMLGDHLALVGDDAPRAVRQPHDVLDLGEALDLGAQLARRLGIGMRDARRVEMAVLGIAHRADELLRVEQRHQLMRFLGRDLLEVEAEIAALGDDAAQPVHARLGGGQQHAAGDVHAGRLARQFLDLLVERRSCISAAWRRSGRR